MRRPGRAAGALLAAVALALFAPLSLLLAWLPPRLGLWLGRRLGDVAWALLPRRRAVTLDNLQRAFGSDRAAAELHRLGVTRVFLQGSTMHEVVTAVREAVQARRRAP